jgi:hypothetical protein
VPRVTRRSRAGLLICRPSGALHFTRIFPRLTPWATIMSPPSGAMSPVQELRLHYILRQPLPDDFNHITLLFGCQLAPFRNRVPFLQAASATGGRCVLRYEDRMIAPGRLLAVVDRLGWREPLLYKICCVPEDCLHPFRLEIIQLLSAKLHRAAKLRFPQARQNFLHIFHVITIRPISNQLKQLDSFDK